MANSSTYEIVLDEIFALQAIFCNNGEFVLHSPLALLSETNSGTDSSFCFSVNLKCSSNKSNEERNSEPVQIVVPLEFSVVLLAGYPDILPQFSLSSAQARRRDLDVLKTRLTNYMETLPDGPKILEMAMWLQEQSCACLTAPSATQYDTKFQHSQAPASRTILLIKLDHMRNSTRYIKTITHWIEELDIGGVMFFSGRLILLLVEGDSGDVEEYLRRHKTCNVDVDSSGNPCKERMMRIITQEQFSGTRYFGQIIILYVFVCRGWGGGGGWRCAAHFTYMYMYESLTCFQSKS